MSESDADRIHREELEVHQQGAAWARYTDEYLVGYVSQHRPSAFHTPAIVEIQRRLVAATRAAGDAATQQTAEVIKLTYALKALTWVLVAIGAAQIVLMLWKG